MSNNSMTADSAPIKAHEVTGTRRTILAGMMAAVLSVLSILQIPMPSGVPITLQTFAVALCGYVLGPSLGAIAALIYLLLGAVGVPVYSGMTGGPGILFGMTGGFIWGFVPMAALCGIGMRKGLNWTSFVCGLAGLASCHVLGFLWFAHVMGMGIGESFLLVSVPYLVKDVLSVVGAALIAVALKKALRKASLM